MRHSLNEIEVTLKKAAAGAGYPYGLAEDIGQAGAWLCAHGYDGLSACLAGLGTGPGAVRPTVTDDGVPLFADACAARCGPSALDLLASDADIREVRLGNIDAPLLLAGLAGAAASAYGTGYTLRFTNGCVMEIGPGGLVVSGQLPASGVDANLVQADDADTPDAFDTVPDGFDVGADLWTDVLALAARTYVPASEASRARGAGAGDIDND